MVALAWALVAVMVIWGGGVGLGLGGGTGLGLGADEGDGVEAASAVGVGAVVAAIAAGASSATAATARAAENARRRAFISKEGGMLQGPPRQIAYTSRTATAAFARVRSQTGGQGTDQPEVGSGNRHPRSSTAANRRRSTASSRRLTSSPSSAASGPASSDSAPRSRSPRSRAGRRSPEKFQITVRSFGSAWK